MILHDRELGPALLFSNVLGLLKLPSIHGRCTQIENLSCTDQIIEGCHGFFNRSIIIPAMDVKNVDIIRLQAFEASLHLGKNSLTRQLGRIAARTTAIAKEELGSNHHFLPIGKIL